MNDYLKYFDRAHYLFEDVHQRFHTEHSLGAFDFFTIIIWKANRAKSKIALKLLAKDPEGRRDLDLARLAFQIMIVKKSKAPSECSV